MKNCNWLRFCKWWHISQVILHLIGGFIFWIVACIEEMHSVAMGLMMGIVSFAAGTVCFLIVPAIILAISAGIRFVPVVGLPVFVFFYIGNLFGDNNFQQFTVVESFWIGLICSVWGTFNIWTAVVANKDEDFNPISIVNE